MTQNLRIAQTEDDIRACLALRWQVFVVEQGVPEADELDGTDEGTSHVMAMQGEDLVGVARFHEDDGVVKISRVCVAKTVRGTGLGAALIRHVCALSSAPKARLGAQTDAMSFYEKLGFVAVGLPYMDAGIPHQDMEKPLP